VESMLLDSKASVRTQAARTARALRETDSSEASSADFADSDRDRFSDTQTSDHAAGTTAFDAKMAEEVSLIDWEELEPQIPVTPMTQPAVHSSSSLTTFASREDELREQMEIAMLLDMDEGYTKRSTLESASTVNGNVGDSGTSSIFDQMALSTYQSNGNNSSTSVTTSVKQSVTSVNGHNSGGPVTTHQNTDIAEQLDIFAGLTVLPTPAANHLPTAPVKRSELDFFNGGYAPPAPVPSLIPPQIQSPMYTPTAVLPLPHLSQYLPNQQQPSQQQQQYHQQQYQQQYQCQPGIAVNADLSSLGNTSSNDSSLEFMKRGSDSSRFVYQPSTVVDVNSFFDRSVSSNPLASPGRGIGDFKFRDPKSQRASIPAPSTTQSDPSDSFSFLSGVLKNPSALTPANK
jgi:hypothetical protein